MDGFSFGLTGQERTSVLSDRGLLRRKPHIQFQLNLADIVPDDLP